MESSKDPVNSAEWSVPGGIQSELVNNTEDAVCNNLAGDAGGGDDDAADAGDVPDAGDIEVSADIDGGGDGSSHDCARSGDDVADTGDVPDAGDDTGVDDCADIDGAAVDCSDDAATTADGDGAADDCSDEPAADGSGSDGGGFGDCSDESAADGSGSVDGGFDDDETIFDPPASVATRPKRTIKSAIYWQSSSIADPCELCGFVSRCGYSVDGNFLLCHNKPGTVEAPEGGFIHRTKKYAHPLLAAPEGSQDWPSVLYENIPAGVEPDLFEDDPLGESQNFLVPSSLARERCGDRRLTLAKKETGVLSLAPVHCDNKGYCYRCGGRWRSRVVNYYSLVWACYSVLYVYIAIDIWPIEARTLRKRLKTRLDRMSSKPLYLASIGPKFLVFFSEVPIDIEGSTEVTPTDALGLLANLALLPGHRTKLSAAKRGSWRWPANVAVSKGTYVKVGFGCTKLKEEAETAARNHFGLSLEHVPPSELIKFYEQWYRPTVLDLDIEEAEVEEALGDDD